MKRRFVTTAVAVAVATVVATTALGAASAKDARQMVLQKSDFPPGARASAKGGDAMGYSVTWNYRTGTKPNQISSSAGVLPNRTTARAGFREFTSDLGPLARRIQLPKYGDEQVATFHVLDGSQLIVRKNTVVWALILQTFLTRGGVTHELTKAEAIAEYKRLAPKMQSRVGNG